MNDEDIEAARIDDLCDQNRESLYEQQREKFDDEYIEGESEYEEYIEKLNQKYRDFYFKVGKMIESINKEFAKELLDKNGELKDG